MIYTVGHTESYLKYFQEQEHPKKKGRDGSYRGGSVWKTYQEAKCYAPVDSGYSVFGVLADWDFDTEESPEGDWQNLIINAELVRLD